MIAKVLNTIKKYNLIENGDGVVVGVSGGPDSVCLLHVLRSISREFNLNMAAVHINHMLRGDESEEDQRFVEGLCKMMDVPLYIGVFDIDAISRSKGISLEEAGREVRYREFDRIADSMGANKIAVAHNKNDQAETVLMHIIRGTGLDGLGGMDYVRDRIVRPLLDVDRREIEEYCVRHSLNPRIDSSNLVNIYTRNKIRLDVVPYINSLFETDITDSICKMSSLLRDDNDFIEDMVGDIYSKSVAKRGNNEICLDISRLAEAHAAVQKRLVRNAIKEVKGDLKEIESIHINSVIDLALHGRTGKNIHLPSGIRAGKSYNTLRIFTGIKELDVELFDEPVNIPGTTLINPIGASIEAAVDERRVGMKNYTGMENNSLIQFFDYEKLKPGINIRKRKNGDVFRPLKSIGTKKLKEYFIDNKIPREDRERMPVVAINNEVVWLVGHKISDKFKVTENTKSMLRLEFKYLDIN